jgi:hypothetical protein
MTCDNIHRENISQALVQKDVDFANPKSNADPVRQAQASHTKKMLLPAVRDSAKRKPAVRM